MGGAQPAKRELSAFLYSRENRKAVLRRCRRDAVSVGVAPGRETGRRDGLLLFFFTKIKENRICELGTKVTLARVAKMQGQTDRERWDDGATQTN